MEDLAIQLAMNVQKASEKAGRLAAMKEVREMVAIYRPHDGSQVEVKITILNRIDAMIAREEGR